MHKVLHIVTHIEGGANTVTTLHKNLIDQNIDSRILYLYPNNNNIPKTFQFPSRKANIIEKIANKIGMFLREDFRSDYKLKGKTEANYNIFTFPFSDYDLSLHAQVKEADLIHMHWASNFLDYNFFKKIDKPIVWTLHDMNPFTGGCHHSQGCTKYETNCKPCPQLTGCKSTDFASENLNYKLKKSNETDINVITLNSLMKKCSEKSALFKKFKHHTIANSINTNVFYPEEKNVSRKKLNLPEDKIIIGFSSFYYAKGKGADLLRDAFLEIKDKYPRLVICNVGYNYSELQGDNIYYLGKISSEETMRSFYSAVDACVIPSREDNLPTVMIESMTCGKPVIGFQIAGIADHVKENENGFVASNINASSLAATIEKFIKNYLSLDTKKIREYAINNFSQELQTKKMIALYQEILLNTNKK